MGLNGYCPPLSGLEVLFLLEARFSNITAKTTMTKQSGTFPTGVRDRSDRGDPPLLQSLRLVSQCASSLAVTRNISSKVQMSWTCHWRFLQGSSSLESYCVSSSRRSRAHGIDQTKFPLPYCRIHLNFFGIAGRASLCLRVHAHFRPFLLLMIFNILPKYLRCDLSGPRSTTSVINRVSECQAILEIDPNWRWENLQSLHAFPA